MDRVKCPLRVHLTTGGDWWITPEGVPRVPPLAGCSAAGRNMGGGRHPNTTVPLASRVDPHRDEDGHSDKDRSRPSSITAFSRLRNRCWL
jgi:hypothetical protein